jgi:hypothetical protein
MGYGWSLLECDVNEFLVVIGISVVLPLVIVVAYMLLSWFIDLFKR